MKNKNFDDFSNRKDNRRKHLNHKSLDKKSNRYDDDDQKSLRKSSIRRQKEEMSAEEKWEDWEEEYDL